MGRSNVGKSSLINALVGRRALARTSQTPGKTRACNVYDVDHAFYLVDLPGYGYARMSQTERTALRRLLEAYLTGHDLAGAVWLLDVRRDPSPADVATGLVLADRGVPVVIALTKSDMIARRERGGRVGALRRALPLSADDSQLILTSARTREGVAELREGIDRLVRRAARRQDEQGDR